MRPQKANEIELNVLEVIMPVRLTATSAVRSALRPVLCGTACLAAVFFGASAPAHTQQSALPQALVIVTGEGSVSAPPDYAQVRGGVTTRAKTAKEALEANTKLMTAITAALSDLGIAQKDIQTSRFSVQPVYAPPQPNTEPKLAGFNAVNDVTVTIRQIGKIGEILDRLVTAGATDVGNVEFLHADLSKTLDQAREAAIADARRKAELYARASGLTLGRIAWITEDSGYAPPMPMAAMKAVRAAPVPISTGEDTLQARITVDFEIAN
jgi:uncharacterized protein YggE